MEPIVVRAKASEWLALLLWPPVSFYAAYVLVGILYGVPKDTSDQAAWAIVWHRTLQVGVPLAILLTLRSAWSIGQEGYWRLDANGLTRGRILPLWVPIAEVESATVGMPDQLHWLLRLLSHIPTAAVQANLQRTITFRETAIVLRLRGRQMLVVGLLLYRGGDAFRERLKQQLGARLVPRDQYTPEQTQALARLRYRGAIHY